MDLHAANLLLLLSCFDNHDIWFGLLEHSNNTVKAPEWLKSITSEESDFLNVIKILLNYSFIELEEDGNSYSIHPVTQDWCQEYLKKHEAEEEINMASLISLCSAIPPASEKADRITEQRLLPHANSLLPFFREGSSLLEHVDDPETLSLLRLIGILYVKQMRYRQAVVPLSRLLDRLEKVFGPDQDPVLEVVKLMGMAYSQFQDWPKAEAMLKRSLAGQEKRLGPGHPDTVDTASYMIRFFIMQGRMEEATSMIRRILAAVQNDLSVDGTSAPWELVNRLGDLVLPRIHGADFQEVENMFQRVYDEAAKTHAMDDLGALTFVSNLAKLKESRGDLDGAEEIYMRVLKTHEKTRSRDDLHTLRAVFDVAIIHMKQNKLESVEAMLLRVLKGREETLGLEDISTLETVFNLGLLYAKQWRLEDAEVVFKRAFTSYRKVFGLQGTSTRIPLEYLKVIYECQGRKEEADSMAQLLKEGEETAK